MKKNIIKIIFISLFILGNINVNAANTCTSEELNRLKELANNVEIKYDYEIVDVGNYADIDYIFKVNNFDINLKIKLEVNGSLEDKIYTYSNQSELHEMYFKDGEKVNFKIYSYTLDNCIDKLLRTISIKLPYYNQYYYYNKEKCENYKDSKYCSEFLEKKINLSDEEIDKLLENEVKNENKEKKIKWLNISYKYFIFIAIGILISLIVIVSIIIVRKRKKDYI